MYTHYVVDKTPLPVNPNEDNGDESAKKIVTRVSIVVSQRVQHTDVLLCIIFFQLFIVCIIGGLYFLWRCNKSRPNVRTK